MTIILLVLVFTTLVVATFTAWTLLRIGAHIASIDRFLRQKGLRMCYRDAEDLQRRFARKGDGPCDS